MSDEAVCRSCGSDQVVEVMDLGAVPPSDVFPLEDAPGPDPRVPLVLVFCTACRLVQLGPTASTVPEQPMAVDSQTALRQARASVERVVRDEGLVAGQSFVEHDSGHGCSWAPFFEEAGLVRAADGEPADLVVDVHHLMHYEDVDPVIARHAARLAPGGVLLLEFFHARPMVVKTLVDTVRHGHFVYFTVLAAVPLLDRHGLVATGAREVPAYGGSVQLTARRAVDSPDVGGEVEDLQSAELADGLGDVEALTAFGARASGVATAFHDHLAALAAAGRSVAAYGAPSKAPVLLALAGVDRSLLPFTVDLSPAKAGRRIPGAGVPIRTVEELIAARPDDVVVLTWDIADEVATQLATMSAGTGWDPRLYVPLPEPREISLPKV
jgi:hypothetical protein